MGLLLACHRGDIDAVRQRLGSGTGHDISELHASTSLLIAAEKGHQDIVMLLMDAVELGLLPEQSFHNSWLQAVADDNRPAKELLQKCKLISCSKYGKADVVRELLHLKTEVDTADPKGRTSLMYSSSEGHTDTVRVLLDNGANVNTVSHEGDTSLLAASQQGYSNIVKLLLERGAAVDLSTKHGATALKIASLHGHTDTVRLLLEYGAKVDVADQKGCTSLIAASQNGHTDIVKMLLESGAKVDFANQEGWTSLMSASLECNTDIVRVLLQSGADIDAAERRGVTSLILACHQGHTDTVRVLLESGAKVDVADQNGGTSLIAASQNGHTAIVKLLLESGAQVDAADQSGCTSLIAASQNGHTAIVKLLLESGAKVDVADQKGFTSLMIASHEGHPDIIKLLLERRATVNLPTRHGTTALILAIRKGHTNIVKELLEAGAEVNLPLPDGRTALMVASQQRHTNIIKLLLGRGATVDLSTNHGTNDLTLATLSGHADVVTQLLERGAEVNLPSLDGIKALMVASAEGHTEIVKLLLERGVPVNLLNNHCTTALTLASQHGRTDAVRLLLESGAEVNLSANHSTTALTWASQQGHADIVRLLLKTGAEVNLSTRSGSTALIRASQSGDTDIVRMLLESGAKVDVADQKGVTSLQIAVQKGHIDIVKLLLERGATVNLRTNLGATALTVGSENGCTETVRMLLEAGADVTLPARLGKTALMQASQNGHTDTVRLLLEYGAKVDGADQQGATSLMMASKKGQADTVRLLLERGAEVNLPTPGGITALMEAGREGHTDTMRVLLDCAATVNTVNQKGQTSLYEASCQGRTQAVKLLLQRGAKIDLLNNQGATALSVAIHEGYIDTVRVLLDYGANANIVAWEGLTNMQLASARGHTEIFRLLLESGATADLPNKQGITALSMASNAGKTDTVRLLLQTGAEVNFVGEDGSTALMEASENGHTDTVKVLLESGATVNFPDHNAMTSLIRASKEGHTDTVRLLLERGADVNFPGGSLYTTALIQACEQGHTDVVKELLESGAKVDVTEGQKSDTAVIVAARNAHWNIVQVLVERGADVFKMNEQKENAVIYLAFGIYHAKWAEKLLKKLLESTEFDVLQNNFYGICIVSFMLVGALLHNKPIPDPFIDLFSELNSTLMIERSLYGYLPEAFHRDITTGSTDVFAPYQGVEGKISLHTLGTAIVCKLPISALHWLTPQHREYLTNMLGQTPLHLLAMENHQLSDMEERIVVIVEQLGFSFSDRDNNGRLAYHIACMWGNDQFLQYAHALDPEIRKHLLVEDHLGQVCLMYTLPNTVSHTLVNSMMDGCMSQDSILTAPKHVRQEKTGLAASLRSYFSKKMTVQQLNTLIEPFREISMVEEDTVSLFTDKESGVANLDSWQNQYWVLTVIELLEIIGKEMGRMEPQLEFEPELKGSVQEYTKCGTLDELDVSLKLVNYEQISEVELFQNPGYDYLLGRQQVSLHKALENVAALQNLRFCTVFWSLFIRTLRRPEVVQFLNTTGLVIDHCKRKHGFVGMLNVCCNINSNPLPISVDLAPCIESDSLYGYIALLRPRHYDSKLLGTEAFFFLELSSSKKDWEFLKYVPLEVLCGYTLVKILRSLADTFQTEDGRVYTAEDILPSYMLKMALLWVLDPEDKFEKVYPMLNKEEILANEVAGSCSADVQNLCSKLSQHSIGYTTRQDSSPQKIAWRNTNAFLFPFVNRHLDVLQQHATFRSDKFFVKLCHELQQHLKQKIYKELQHNEEAAKCLSNMQVVCRIMDIWNTGTMPKEEFLQTETYRSSRMRTVNLVQELLQICQGDNTNCEHQQEKPTENDREKDDNMLKKLRAIHDKCVTNPDSLSVKERILPYVLVTQCRELRVQNGIDPTLVREEVYGGTLLNPDTAESGEAETIYSREFHTDRNRTLDLRPYPDLTEETARKCRVWALRILRFLDHLLHYMLKDESSGVMNYYLPGQKVYARDKPFAIALCQTLEALLQE